eukprot:gene4898-9765_t
MPIINSFRMSGISRLSIGPSRVMSKIKMSSVEAITSPVRVRFAPSPTGSLHVGGARTALYNWLLAKQTKGQFIIRVEDTDEARSTRASEESILNDLKWLGMTWDEGPEIGGPHGPYRQSERKDIYLKYAEQLLAKGEAYRCFCTEEELEQKRVVAEAEGKAPQYDGTWRDADPVEVQRRLDAGEPYTVRFKVPAGKSCYIDDIVRGRVTWDADASLGDFIILRSSGMPVYNFCVAVDDASMGITHVIRAEEHLTNTLRQLLVLEALGYKPPTYAHCSLILGSDRSKLSKRHGATSCKQFSEQGFLPEAMVNYLAALGWNDGTTKEIYTTPELIQAFSMNRIVKSAAVFDMDRLKWMNGQYIKALPAEQLETLVKNALETAEPPLLPLGAPIDSKITQFIKLAIHMSLPSMLQITDVRNEVNTVLSYTIEETLATDPHVNEILEDGFDTIISALSRDFESGALPKGSEENFPELWKAYMKTLGKELGRKGKKLFHPVRLALTGTMSGADLGEQLQLLSLASEILPSETPIITLEARMLKLKTVDIKAKV